MKLKRNKKGDCQSDTVRLLLEQEFMKRLIVLEDAPEDVKFPVCSTNKNINKLNWARFYRTFINAFHHPNLDNSVSLSNSIRLLISISVRKVLQVLRASHPGGRVFRTQQLGEIKKKNSHQRHPFDLKNPNGPAPKYSCYYDKHLRNFFEKPGIRKKLIEQGFVPFRLSERRLNFQICHNLSAKADLDLEFILSACGFTAFAYYLDPKSTQMRRQN